MNNLSIQCFTIKEIGDNPKIFERYKDPFGYIKNCDAGWINVLTSNPLASENDLALILTVKDQIVIGRLGLYAGLVRCNNKNERTFWLDGFFLNDEYKNSGAGGLMILRAISFSKSLLASGGPRKDCQLLYLGTGFYELGPLKRYLYFYDTDVILKKYHGFSRIRFLFSHVLNLLFSFFYMIRIGNRSLTLDYRKIESFNNQIDDIFNKSRQINCFPKNASVLNWVLQSNKHIDAFNIFQKEKLIGYCLLRQSHQNEGYYPEYLPQMKIGCLLDYYVTDNSEPILRDLILFCIDFFKQKNVDVCSLQVYDDELVSICRRFGLIHKGGNKVFFRPSPEIKYNHSSSWFLTHGTSDVILGDSI